MIIRPVEPRDRDGWLFMRSLLWPDGASEHAGEIDAFLVSEGPEAVYVAEEEGRLIGFIELSLRSYAEGCTGDRVPYVEGWYVEADARRRGVGRALMSAAEGWARGLGVEELASDAEFDNTAGASAHRALGFDEVVLVRCFRKQI